MAHIEATSENFQQEVLESDMVTLVDFWAPWCGPCRVLAPTLDLVAEDPNYGSKIKIVKVNVDDNDELSNTYNISSIPTIKFFKGGKIVHEFSGALPKDELLKEIDLVLEQK